MEIKLGDCVRWKIHKPSCFSKPSKSPKFSIQGYLCRLTLENVNGASICTVRIKSDAAVASFVPCWVTVCVKEMVTGNAFLSTTTIFWGLNQCLWWKPTKTIRETFPEFFYNGTMSFFITFGNDVSKDNLSLNLVRENGNDEKSAQMLWFLGPCLGSFFEYLSKLMDGGSLSHDVKLKCGDHTFGAHKNILSARSPVFARMLESDMVEGRTGQVEILDMDSKGLGHFLWYLYTGTLPKLTTDRAMSLYGAGDKYAVAGLMRRCSDFLTKKLTSDNACYSLLLADVHGDSQFKKNIFSYIRRRLDTDENFLSRLTNGNFSATDIHCWPGSDQKKLKDCNLQLEQGQQLRPLPEKH